MSMEVGVNFQEWKQHTRVADSPIFENSHAWVNREGLLSKCNKALGTEKLLVNIGMTLQENKYSDLGTTH